MKKRTKYILTVLSLTICTALSACGNQLLGATGKVETVENGVAESVQESIASQESTSSQEGITSQESTASQDNQPADNVQKVTLKNPCEGAYLPAAEKSAAKPKTLTLLSQKANEITDDSDWFIKNELYVNSVAEQHSYGALAGKWGQESIELAEKWGEENNICYFDDSYIYVVDNMQDTLKCENAIYMNYLLTVYDRADATELFYIDFSDFCRFNEEIYREMDIDRAQIKDGVLYASLCYNGYAEPDTSFVVAVSLDTMEVLWKSEAQTCNSYNFLIVDDVLLCGYGFSEEPDYLYQLDLQTGKVLDKTSVKTSPYYLVRKDGDLYVRCYNTDYVFAVE